MPPRVHEKLLGLITPASRRDDVLVTMQDQFEEQLRKHGDEFARRQYRKDVALSIVSLLLDWVQRGLGIAVLLRQLGLF